VNTARRDRWLVAAGMVVILVALVVVGRLQAGNLPKGDPAGSQPTTSTAPTDATPVASGLAVAGRVVLPSPAAAVAVGEDAVWVLLGQGILLRVDPDRHRVTGRLELGAPTGPLAVGAGAVWVGNGQATVTARVDPVRLRVTARFGGYFGGYVVAVAHGVLWSYCCRRGYQPMGFSRIDARMLRPRPPLVVTDALGRRQPVGRLAVGTDAVWTQTSEDERLWRVPLGGGPARAVRVPGIGYGLAADAGAVWVLSGSGDQSDRTGQLRRLDQRTGTVTVTTPLPDLAVGLAAGPVVGGGAVWLAGPYTRLQDGGGILVRADPTSGRVTGWLRSPLGFAQDVLAAGPHGAWVGMAVPELLHLVPA
jgi:outer membrane protein assembly factor BamB